MQRCSTRELVIALTAAVDRLTARLDAAPSIAADSGPVSLDLAAEKLGVTRRHLEKLAGRGLVKIVKFGRRRTLAAGEFERLAANGV